jgi:hypothetical protein
VFQREGNLCAVEGCDAPAVAKGLCPKHNARQRKHGNVDTVLTRGRRPDDIKAQQNKAKRERRQLRRQELLTLNFLEGVLERAPPELDPDFSRIVDLAANWLFMGGLDDSQGQVVDGVIEELG